MTEGHEQDFTIENKLEPSQNNDSVQVLNWAITIWEAESFKNRMHKLGQASLSGNLMFLDIDPLKSIKVSEEKDFILAEKIMKI